VGKRSSFLIIILVFGVLFSLLFASSQATKHTTTTLTAIPTVPKVSEQQAIAITENDLRQHPRQDLTRTCVCEITPALADKYVPISEFQSGKVHLPLEYYNPNGFFYEINSTTTTIIGKWNNDNPPVGYHQYNGKNEATLEIGKGRLYWILDGIDNNGIPFLYNIDAISGEILYPPQIAFK
jgi:hypothetical protein